MMVTLRDGPTRSAECFRPNCRICYPVAAEPEAPVAAPVEPEQQGHSPGKAQQIKNAIFAATGVRVESLDVAHDAT